MAERYALAPGLDLRSALRTCARLGHARIPAGVTAPFLEALREELDAGPFRPFGESFGPVRQQIDGYDVDIPAPLFPLLTSLCQGIRALVRADGRPRDGDVDPERGRDRALRAGLDRYHAAHGRQVVPTARGRGHRLRSSTVLDLRVPRPGRRHRAMDLRSR